MSLAESLTPSLSRTMPAVARALTWLLVADALMVSGVLIAAVCLTYLRMRLVPGETRRFTEGGQLGRFRETVRILYLVRRVIVGLAILVGVTWAALAVSGRIGADLVELLISVICGAVLLPVYFVITILQKVLGDFANRLEELSRAER